MKQFQRLWEGRAALVRHRVEGGGFKANRVIMTSENTTQLFFKIYIKIRETYILKCVQHSVPILNLWFARKQFSNEYAKGIEDVLTL